MLGDYELLKKLGQGAMGAVYLARRTSDDRRVALKVLPPEMAEDHEYMERFRREARAAIKLRNANIVRAYEVGEARGFHFLAMEYIDGFDLDDGLDQQPNGRYTAEEVLAVARDMALALEAADEAGVVHRDIKPANILRGRDGTNKLTDLGLTARGGIDEEKVTQTGLAVGTPFYISPEQAQGQQFVDVRADFYSLGATLYHLATGRLPFDDENAVVVMTSHVRETPPPLRTLVPDLPDGLCALIEKLMAKKPDHRPQTPRELLDDVARARTGRLPSRPGEGRIESSRTMIAAQNARRASSKRMPAVKRRSSSRRLEPVERSAGGTPELVSKNPAPPPPPAPKTSPSGRVIQDEAPIATGPGALKYILWAAVLTLAAVAVGLALTQL